ncbi:hypothetical protein BIV57_18340, partial [Mangrovactinospora gilvigrisea]
PAAPARHRRTRSRRALLAAGAAAALAVGYTAVHSAAAPAHADAPHAAAVRAVPAAGTVNTPYGHIPRSQVVAVGKGQTLRVAHGQVEKIDVRTHRVLAHLGKATANAAASAPRRVPATQLGGNCPADWGQQHIQSFSTTWTVPPKPSDSTSTTTFFIWNGLAGGALQPVLQWGNGTAAYQIANWYYVGGKYAHGTYHSVSPGQTLTGTITFVSAANGTYTYKESFAGYPAADVTVQRTSPADGVIECFEPYTNGDATKNPNAKDVAMRSIKLTDQPGYTPPSTLSWTGNSNAPSTEVVNPSSSGGEVDLYFNGL